MQKELVLCENDMYFVTFDWYTPRPHVIIIGKSGYDKKCLKSMIPENPKPIDLQYEMNQKEKLALLDIASETYKAMQGIVPIEYLSDVPGVGSPAVLSFHFGSWFAQSKERHFHAHICIDISVYEKWIKRFKDNIELKNKLNQTKTRTLDEYLMKAKQPQKDYSKCDIKDLKIALKQKSPEDDRLIGDKNVSLAYHPKFLRLGFESKGQDSLKMLEEIDAFIIRHGLQKESGGNICIDLSKKGFFGYKKLTNDTDVPQAYLDGYLQLEGKSLGMVLRAFGKGKTWLENDHSGMDMIVYT